MNSISRKMQRQTFLILWITYASFYLGRVNFSVAIPGIMTQFGWEKTTIGIIGTALFWAYAAGQLINGYLGDRVGSRIMVGMGLLCSAVLNAFFPLTTSLVMMAAILAANGYFQAAGWGPIVKVLSNWYPVSMRGRAAGRLGTSYILGGALAALLAGAVYSLTQDWRSVFVVPAILMVVSAVHWITTIRVAPGGEREATCTNKFLTRVVFGNVNVWLTGLALFCANIMRYGFLTWAVTYFFEVQGAAISVAAYKSLVFPIAGAAGAIMAGWLSDAVFTTVQRPSGKAGGVTGKIVTKTPVRAGVAALFLAAAGLSAAIFPFTTHWLSGLSALACVGFYVFGAHPLLVGAAPMDCAGRAGASSATGFIDCLGYIGAGLTAVGTGLLVDNLGWNAGFAFWVGAAFVGAALMGVLWLRKRKS